MAATADVLPSGESGEQAQGEEAVPSAETAPADPWGQADHDPWGGSWATGDGATTTATGATMNDRWDNLPSAATNPWDWADRNSEWRTSWDRRPRRLERWTGGRWEEDHPHDNGSSTTAGHSGSTHHDSQWWSDKDEWWSDKGDWWSDKDDWWHDKDDWNNHFRDHDRRDDRRGAPTEKMAVPGSRRMRLARSLGAPPGVT
eukprot:s897_g4.t1